jgi:hypothetical protein
VHDGDFEIHDWWIALIDESDGTAGGVVMLCAQRDAQGVLGLREPISAHNLRKFLSRFVDKPRLGQRIRRVRDVRKNQTVYRVESV